MGRDFCCRYCRRVYAERFRNIPAELVHRASAPAAIRDMKTIMRDILLDPALSVEAPWNDIAHRSGLISRACV